MTYSIFVTLILAVQLLSSYRHCSAGGARMQLRRDKLQPSPAMSRVLPSNIFNGKDLVRRPLRSLHLSYMTYPVADDKLASYAYSTVMMGLITVLLFEGMSPLIVVLSSLHHLSRADVSKQYPYHALGCLPSSWRLGDPVDYLSPIHLGGGADSADQDHGP